MNRRSPKTITVVSALAAFAVLCALGTWQIKRLAWKEALLESIDERMAQPEKSIEELIALQERTGDVDYVPVTVTGQFLHDREQHFFATHKGLSGYYIYTPLSLADERIVFVNRGFVPFDRKDPETRIEGQIKGDVTIKGLARNTLQEKPSWAVPENEPEQNIYYWKDIDAMAAQSDLPLDPGLLPLFVDADGKANPGGLPVGGVTMINLPNNHLQYAITWFGLATALIGVLGAWLWSQRKSGAISG